MLQHMVTLQHAMSQEKAKAAAAHQPHGASSAEPRSRSPGGGEGGEGGRTAKEAAAAKPAVAGRSEGAGKGPPAPQQGGSGGSGRSSGGSNGEPAAAGATGASTGAPKGVPLPPGAARPLGSAEAVESGGASSGDGSPGSAEGDAGMLAPALLGAALLVLPFAAFGALLLLCRERCEERWADGGRHAGGPFGGRRRAGRVLRGRRYDAASAEDELAGSEGPDAIPIADASWTWAAR